MSKKYDMAREIEKYDIVKIFRRGVSDCISGKPMFTDKEDIQRHYINGYEYAYKKLRPLLNELPKH